jgi:hypothetical protein
MRKITKFLSSALLIILLLSLDARPANAQFFDLDDISAPEAMDDIFEDLGIDKGELKYEIDTMNQSRQKKQQPQVSLSFEPTDPTPGEKVTVTATPTYFLNDDKDIYFTWFLQSKGCRIGNYKEECDANDNGVVTIEDFKVKAARIMVSNDFEWEKAENNGLYDQHINSQADHNSDGYRAYMGGNDQKGKADYCYIHDVSDGTEYMLSDCKHIFPNARGNVTGDGCFSCNYGTECFSSGAHCSDDDHFEREDLFWHANPSDPGTTEDGSKDEAKVAGLGAYQFTWTYSEGDKVGVAVEGISIEPTQQDDSSYRTMWALNNPTACQSELNSHQKIDLGEDAPDRYRTGMSSDDINSCLENCLISPTEGGGVKEKLDVNLSYSPKFPMNDPEGEDGDILIIQSTVDNEKNTGYLKYDWQVFESNEPNPDSWGDSLAKSDLPDASQTQGIGLETFKFKLNMPDVRKYLKVKLTVTENVSSNLTREGHNDVVIPISSLSDKIGVYRVNVNDSLNLSLATGEGGERCTDRVEKTSCPIVKDEIIGLRAPGNGLTDYYWTLNGDPIKPLPYESGDNMRTVYFPVLENPGFQYNVNLMATNINTGKKVNLTKSFDVIEPQVQIVSNDRSVLSPNYLGEYIDLDGNSWPDFSDNNFGALDRVTLSLGASFLGFVPQKEDYVWILNGQALDQNNSAEGVGYYVDDTGNLSIGPYEDGVDVSVGIISLYTQDNNTKKVLYKYWDVPIDQFYDKKISHGINIHISNDYMPATISQAKPSSKKILAAVYSGTPEYMMFILKIVLTMSVLLFLSKLIFSFIPSQKDDRI